MYKIVLVEDDIDLANEVKIALERFNYKVYLIEDFQSITDFILKVDPHLVIMDITLPYNDGFYWTTQIRNKSTVPILFMSSRDERLEKVMAMSIGADDYITKPIDLELTIIKIQAILRRAYDYETSTESADTLSYEGLTLDLKKFVISYGNEKKDLTKNEYKILQKLMLHPKQYVNRDELMNYLWDNDSFIDDNAFNVNLSRLRKKIVDISGEDLIETKRKVGYRIGK
ncbi:response regulator transcription factor [Mycoplasma sp. P36-A1]|uniref:response regulator transcription factor n=1 Tax=Mycoplasma sp. P36-A1 TaxID=3252900 RepID=UPI003C2F11C6